MGEPAFEIAGEVTGPTAVPNVVLQGLDPMTPIGIEASMRDDNDTVWRSRADMYADVTGVVSSGGSASHGGTYRNLDPLGLAWSMMPEGIEKAASIEERYRLFPSAQPVFDDSHKTIDIDVQAVVDGKTVASTRYVKRQISPDIAVHEVGDDGVRGLFYAPATPAKNTAIIVMGGSGGGIDRYWARAVASEGHFVLNLAYFAFPGLPDNLANIPLEYFKQAIDWLKARTGTAKVALQGASRGGEAVLLIASTYPDDVAGVVAYVPVHLVVSGLVPGSSAIVPSWTLNGAPLPCVPTPVPTAEDSRARHISLARGLAVAPFYREALQNAESDDRFWIPVERIRAPILMITATDDAIWPCSWAAERAKSRIESRGASAHVEHLALQGAGHITPPPGTVTSLSTSVYHVHARELIAIGGTPAVNAAAGARAWRRTVDFYAEHLS